MAFRLEISYACAVKETVFLGSGWGHRDVRGPYLTLRQGQICLPAFLFDKKFYSKVMLTFSLSNTCQHEAVEISCSYINDIKSETIIRNGEADIMMPETLGDNRVNHIISVSATFLDVRGSRAVISPVLDVVALDKIVIERNVDPTIPY